MKKIFNKISLLIAAGLVLVGMAACSDPDEPVTSVEFNKLFRRHAFLASIGPSFSWPIFQGGNLVANMKVAEAKMDEAALKYEL